MLYLIDGKYYMLRNREYVLVDVELTGNEFSIKPNRDNVIEMDDKVKAKPVLMEEVIKKKKASSNSKQKNNKYEI